MVLCVCVCGIIKTIPGFYPQFLAELQKPLEFPETRVFCYANKVTLGGPPEIFQTRAGHQKAHTVRVLELCKFKVYNVSIWYIYILQDDYHQITTRVLADISIPSRSYFVSVMRAFKTPSRQGRYSAAKNIKTVLSAAFKWTSVLLAIINHAAQKINRTGQSQLETCTLWPTESHRFPHSQPLATITHGTLCFST